MKTLTPQKPYQSTSHNPNGLDLELMPHWALVAEVCCDEVLPGKQNQETTTDRRLREHHEQRLLSEDFWWFCWCVFVTSHLIMKNKAFSRHDSMHLSDAFSPDSNIQYCLCSSWNWPCRTRQTSWNQLNGQAASSRGNLLPSFLAHEDNDFHRTAGVEPLNQKVHLRMYFRCFCGCNHWEKVGWIIL